LLHSQYSYGYCHWHLHRRQDRKYRLQKFYLISSKLKRLFSQKFFSRTSTKIAFYSLSISLSGTFVGAKRRHDNILDDTRHDDASLKWRVILLRVIMQNVIVPCTVVLNTIVLSIALLNVVPLCLLSLYRVSLSWVSSCWMQGRPKNRF